MLRAVREAAWLTPARARAWCVILAVMTALGVAGLIRLSPHAIDPGGKPLGTDFISFYAASRLALGQPEAAYNPALHAAAQQVALPVQQYGYTTFLYPPPFLLLCLPLALVAYGPSLALWLAAGLAALAAALRGTLPWRVYWLPLLAFPGVLVNAGHGQNGFLTSAMFATYISYAARLPVLAGAALGALIIKPQLAIAVPLVLFAAGHIRAPLAAAATAAALCALSWAAFGTPTWLAFLHLAPTGRLLLEQGANGFARMPSLFAATRLLGGGITLAWSAQALMDAAVAAALLWAVPHKPGAAAEGALMATAALLMTPWLFDYDLVILAGPLAWLMAQATATRFLPWEKIAMLAAYVLPLLSREIALKAGIPVAPAVLAAFFACVCRRALQDRPLPA